MIVIFFSAFNSTEQDSIIMLRDIHAQKISKNGFIRMIEDAQETFISLYKNLSRSEWDKQRDFMSNTCRDLENYIKTLQPTCGPSKLAVEWASKHAYDYKTGEVDRSLFCILQNLQLLKLYTKEYDTAAVSGAVDMRWYTTMETIFKETQKIAIVRKKEERAILKPDYLEPKRKRKVRAASWNSEVQTENIETESLRRPTNSCVPVFRFNKWPRQNDPRLEKESIRF